MQLADGISLAALMDAVFSLPTPNRDAVRMIARALESGDFILEPALGSLWHLKYVYERPGSMTVVDMTLSTPDATFASTDVRLRLRP